MAEARSEEEDENMTRDTREQQVVRRQSNSSGGKKNETIRFLAPVFYFCFLMKRLMNVLEK